jgi:hypothetical protein
MLEQIVKYCHKVLPNHYHYHKLLLVLSLLFSTWVSIVSSGRASSEPTYFKMRFHFTNEGIKTVQNDRIFGNTILSRTSQ